MKRLENIRKWVLNNKLPVFIILCALFLRMWRVQDFAMFLADQGRDAIIIRKILTFEHFPLIGPPSSIGQVYLGPFFYYLMAPFLLLFFFNPAGLAYGVSFLFTLGLIAAYFIISGTEKKGTGLIFLVLTAFSYQLIWFARFSWNPNLLPVFSFLTLYFLYKTLTTKKTLYAILCGAFFALSFQLHHLAAFLAAPIAVSYAYKLFAERKKTTLLLSSVYALSAFLLITSPLILFDLKHNFLNTKNLFSLFAHQNVVAGGEPMQRLILTNHAFWQAVLQLQYPQTISTILSLALAGLLVYFFAKKKLSLLTGIHAVSFFSFIYLFSRLSGPRHPHYYGPAYLSFFLVISSVFGRFWKNGLFYRALIGGAVILFVGINAKNYYFIAGKPSSQINHSSRVAASIVPHIDNKPYNFATYPVEFTSEEAYLYFLEKQGLQAADRSAQEVTGQMYVLCNKEPCDIIDSHSWNISMFGKAKIDTIWETDGIKIYRLVHDEN